MNKIITLFINLILLSTLNGADRAQGVDFALLGAYHPSHMAVTPQKAKEFEITIIRGYGSMYFRNESTQNQKKLAQCNFATYNKNGSRLTDNIPVLLHTLLMKDWQLADLLTNYKTDFFNSYKNKNALNIALEEGAPLTLLQKLVDKGTPNTDLSIIAYTAQYARCLESFKMFYEFPQKKQCILDTDEAFSLSFLNHNSNIGKSIRDFLKKQPDIKASYLEAIKDTINLHYYQNDILSPIVPKLIKETFSPSSELSNKDIRELFEYAIDAEDYDTFCLMHQNLSQPLPKEHIRLLLAKASVAQTKDSKKPFVRTILHNMGGKNLSNIAALALKTNDLDLLQTLENKKKEREHKELVALTIAKIKATKITPEREIKHKIKRRRRDTPKISVLL
ncbi:MAG: hypothetical protein ACJAZS_000293 [Alteromonas naphthalenivorans]|jgi:hypothetical protein